MTPKILSHKRGFTIIEMFIALTIFSGIMVITTMLLRQSVWIWTSGDSRESAGLVLRKARAALQRDLAQADLGVGPAGEPHWGETTVSSSMGGGDAIWFLSAVGANGEFAREEDGFPFWQRNIIYYMAKPQNHDSLYKQSCSAGTNPQGDDVCPHKMLIRLVVDNPPVTDPLPPPGAPPIPGLLPEELVDTADIGNYLVAPTGLDVSAINALPGVEQVQIVTTGMLWFKVDLPPDLPTEGRQLDMRAVAIAEARKEANVGVDSLINHPTTLENLYSIYPKN